MRMKKVLSLALAGALVCTGTASVWAANASKQEIKLREAKLFTDAVKTTENGKLTKGDAVVMVLNALGYKEDVNTKEDYTKLNPFADASGEYKGYLGLACDLGFVQKADKFYEKEEITKRKLLEMVLRALNYKDAYTDTDNLAVKQGLVDESDYIDYTVTKAEAAKIILNSLNAELGDGTKTKFGEYLVKSGILSEDKLATLGVKAAVKDKEDVHILYFNDFHGNITEEVTGKKRNMGMAKMVGYVNEFKATHPNTIVLSGGDSYQGTADSNLTFGKPVTAMMKGMNMVASAVGNHEFDWGYEKIEGWAKDGNFKYLASNIYEKKTNKPVKWAKPYMIVKKAGINIGIIGLAHPDTPSLSKTEYVENFEFRDPVVAANEWVKYLKDGKAKEGKADVVIALTHIDSDQDFETKEITGNATKLANEVKGLDLVLSAHSHRSVIGKVNNVPILQAYCYGRAVGHVTLDVDKKVTSKKVKVKVKTKADKKKAVKKSKYKIVKKTTYKVKDIATKLYDANTIKDKIIKSAEADDFYNKLQAEIADEKNKVLGEATEAFTHNRGDKGTVTLLGRWACEVMAEEAKAQIAIQNGGGLRRTMEKGKITMGDLYEIMPFDNYLTSMDLKGKDIKKAIDHGIDMPSTTDGAFSGLIVEYDGTKPYGSKITKITLSDGTPLEDEKTYRVVTNDFVFGKGDGYDFSGATNVSMTIPIRDVLVAAIEKAKTITPKKVDYIKDISK
ncbi:MAG: 5'-nucleotidase C-terminal domain-containing protein [Catonella sp.]|uniref:5'-nucleotidase C-terminal domain-containing protein n=1 Tax=Catonella sp. TaxID=2382125 RepID=UPI003FA09F22